MIIIHGMVGAGKSTVSKMLAQNTGKTLYAEPVETNPYLEKFYESPSDYSFAMQVFLLHDRFKRMKEAEACDNGCVMDTSVHTNDMFAQLHYQLQYMSRDDYYMNYCRLSETFKSLLQPPKLLVYLKCSTEVAIMRILKRGRAGELRAPMSYWTLYNKIQEQYYQEYTAGKKVCLDVSDLDIVDNPAHAEGLISCIMKSYEE